MQITVKEYFNDLELCELWFAIQAKADEAACYGLGEKCGLYRELQNKIAALRTAQVTLEVPNLQAAA